MELTPSEVVSDSIDFDKNEGDIIFVKIHEWSTGFSTSTAIDEYRDSVRKAGAEPSEDCINALQLSGIVLIYLLVKPQELI